MGTYKKPQKRVHRGFFYLDDDTVINSLSAVEAGKVDEVVAKVNSAREGGFGGGIGAYGAKLEGAKKTTSELEEEMVRIRTRFSIYEIWYQNLRDSKAIGTFDGWGNGALDGVEPGDVVEMRARLEIAPLQTAYRLFMWFAEQARSSGTMFTLKGDELKEIKESERNMKVLFSGGSEKGEFLVTAAPEGGAGPSVAMQLSDHWVIGDLGHLAGTYSVVGQVDQVLGEGDEFPALRIARSAPPTPLESETIKEAVQHFIEPAKALGIKVSAEDSQIAGPALLLSPIAIHR